MKVAGRSDRSRPDLPHLRSLTERSAQTTKERILLPLKFRDSSLELRNLASADTCRFASPLEFSLRQSTVARGAMAAESHRVRGLKATLRTHEP